MRRAHNTLPILLTNRVLGRVVISQHASSVFDRGSAYDSRVRYPILTIRFVQSVDFSRFGAPRRVHTLSAPPLNTPTDLRNGWFPEQTTVDMRESDEAERRRRRDGERERKRQIVS